MALQVSVITRLGRSRHCPLLCTHLPPLLRVVHTFLCVSLVATPLFSRERMVTSADSTPSFSSLASWVESFKAATVSPLRVCRTVSGVRPRHPSRIMVSHSSLSTGCGRLGLSGFAIRQVYHPNIFLRAVTMPNVVIPRYKRPVVQALSRCAEVLSTM